MLIANPDLRRRDPNFNEENRRKTNSNTKENGDINVYPAPEGSSKKWTY